MSRFGREVDSCLAQRVLLGEQAVVGCPRGSVRGGEKLRKFFRVSWQ